MRKIFGFLFCFLTFTAYAAAGFISYVTYKNHISFEKGLLIFIPVFIVSYWFNTFFSQILSSCKKTHTDKILYSFFTRISYICSLILIGFWIYIFISKSMYLQIFQK